MITTSSDLIVVNDLIKYFLYILNITIDWFVASIRRPTLGCCCCWIHLSTLIVASSRLCYFSTRCPWSAWEHQQLTCTSNRCYAHVEAGTSEVLCAVVCATDATADRHGDCWVQCASGDVGICCLFAHKYLILCSRQFWIENEDNLFAHKYIKITRSYQPTQTYSFFTNNIWQRNTSKT